MAKKNRRKPQDRKPGRPADVVVSEIPSTPTAARKRVMGRPSTYSDEYPDLLIEHMSQGFSFLSFGGVVDPPCATSTLYEWMEAHPEFSEARKRGENASRRWWEIQGAVGMHSKVFNSTVWIFNMKNRFKWADRSEISGPDGGPIAVRADEPLTPEEVSRLAELEAKVRELEAG